MCKSKNYLTILGFGTLFLEMRLNLELSNRKEKCRDRGRLSRGIIATSKIKCSVAI